MIEKTNDPLADLLREVADHIRELNMQLEANHKEQYEAGWSDGYEDGHLEGNKNGYDEGYGAGISDREPEGFDHR